jgi:hypothetical protein
VHVLNGKEFRTVVELEAHVSSLLRRPVAARPRLIRIKLEVSNYVDPIHPDSMRRNDINPTIHEEHEADWTGLALSKIRAV